MRNFYSYSNNNHDYVKAVYLPDVRSMHIGEGAGKSEFRFSVVLDYKDDKMEAYHYLSKPEAEKVYTEILKLLNEE